MARVDVADELPAAWLQRASCRERPSGDAAVAWTTAYNERRWFEQRDPHAGLRERFQLHRRADRAAERIGPLRDAFEALAGPERARLRAELPDARKTLDELAGRYAGRNHFTVAHPEALRRLDRLDSLIATAAWELDVGRQDLDGIAPQRPQPNAPEHGIDRLPDWDRGHRTGSRPRHWTMRSGMPSAGAAGQSPLFVRQCPPASRPSPAGAGSPAVLTPATRSTTRPETDSPGT
ncbi:MAG: hypothetical protein ACR2LJ_12020 [Acidimicrobiales bacterium]